jgi:estrogen-related receptor beta like 1
MADEEPTVVAADGSGAFMMMDEILERLKMLDYEMQFHSFKPLTHTYFAMASSNPNEQFFYFMSLCSWLLGLLGSVWHTPSQMDDPNSSASSLYAKLQEVGAPTSFGGWQKLKVGYGEPCCTILQWLLEQVRDAKAGHAREPSRQGVHTPRRRAATPPRAQALRTRPLFVYMRGYC